MKNATLHWADEKEITSYRPLFFMLFFIKILPRFISLAITHFVAILFFIFSKRAKLQCSIYQKHMQTFCPHFKVNILRQIMAFSLSLTEKVEAWIGRIGLDMLDFCNDDIANIKSRLENGKGAVVICSHEGNSEILRSLASWGKTGVSHTIPIVSVMDTKSTAHFNKMLEAANSNYKLNVVDADNITPATIEVLSCCIANGGLVVIAGDRTANHNRNRILENKFLGQKAAFAFGAFYMPLLLDCPVYFFFALRNCDIGLKTRYTMHVHKSTLPACKSKKDRLIGAKKLCSEFASLLEKYTLEKPYQWYNFFNFWASPTYQ